MFTIAGFARAAIEAKSTAPGGAGSDGRRVGGPPGDGAAAAANEGGWSDPATFIPVRNAIAPTRATVTSANRRFIPPL